MQDDVLGAEQAIEHALVVEDIVAHDDARVRPGRRGLVGQDVADVCNTGADEAASEPFFDSQPPDRRLGFRWSDVLRTWSRDDPSLPSLALFVSHHSPPEVRVPRALECGRAGYHTGPW